MLQISRKVRGRNGVATGKVRSRYVQGTFKVRDRFGVTSRKVRDSFGIIQTESAQKSRFLSRFLFTVIETSREILKYLSTTRKQCLYSTNRTISFFIQANIHWTIWFYTKRILLTTKAHYNKWQTRNSRVCQNRHILFYIKAPTFSSQGFVMS